MGQVITHRCRCGVDYECPFCADGTTFVCPTVNGDENGNQCDVCEAEVAVEYANAELEQEALADAEAQENDELEYAIGMGDRLEDDYTEESKP